MKTIVVKPEYIEQIKKESDDGLKNLLKRYKSQNSEDRAKIAEYKIRQGYWMPAGAFKSIGFTDEDFADLQRLDKQENAVKRIVDGQVEDAVVYKYRLKGSYSPEECVDHDLTDFILRSGVLDAVDRKTLKDFDERYAELSDKIETEYDAVFNEAVKPKDAQADIGSLESELEEVKTEWKSAINGMCGKYNANKRFTAYLKDLKATIKAKQEKSCRKELFSIALRNIKIMSVQAEINDRLCKRQDYVGYTADRLIAKCNWQIPSREERLAKLEARLGPVKDKQIVGEEIPA